ncbi:sugar ABC transporter substrate-binding protein [Conexibacter sp. CPCC 206217]|uniref:sugar ABC transporter substrate-binding protein n=1 Tax=Conexibacter sp. CPCC 206217 TaxID=3064574 RepID=UPI002727390C|nr:sugar ABC transporter substrate-binding protein [Conexibacter sp. CPCC 206217]MDO8212043.1 sugar ABC transporter substrate-binding protein [Conexibacter sp. CPCC 206217]
MRKPFATVLAMLLAAVLFSACGSSDDDGGASTAAAAGATSASSDAPAADSDKSIYINQFAKGLRAFTRRSEGIIDYARSRNWKVIEDAYGDNTPETQIQQIENALTKRPSAIFLIPINPDALTPIIAQAKQQGVAVVTMGSNVADPSQVVSFVSYTPDSIGRQKADYIARALRGRGRVGVVDGPRGANFAEGQKRGLEEEFANYPDIELVDAGYNDWSGDAGLKATENLLQRAGGRLDAIYFSNDDQAVGGIQAIRDRGLDPATIVTVSSDGSPAAVDLIRRGELTYTTSSCSFAAGRLAAEQADKQFQGQTPPAEVPVKQLPITRDTVERVLGLPKEECGS